MATWKLIAKVLIALSVVLFTTTTAPKEGKPMLPLTLEIIDQHGIQYDPPFRGLRWAKTFYGGEDLWAAFILDRDTSQDYPDVAYGNDVVVRNGLEPIFKGEIRQIKTDLETVTVKVLGLWVHLDDHAYGGMGKLWCESRYGRWRPTTADEQPGHVPERFYIDNQNRLFIAPVKGEVIGTPNHHSGSLYYLSNYDTIQRISFDYELEDTALSVWQLNLASFNADWTGATLLWSVTGAGAPGPFSGVKDITLVTPKPLIVFSIWYGAPEVQYNGETGEDAYMKITNLRLWGETGPLSRAIESPSVGHIAEDILRGGRNGPR